MSSRFSPFAGFLFLSLFLGACSGPNQGGFDTKSDADSTEIVGGKAVSSKDARAARVAMISLDDESGNSEICTGTFIAEDLVLTAAHCVNEDPAMMGLSFDVDPFNDSKVQILTVTGVIKHPNALISGTERNDLALVQFAGGLPKGAQITALPEKAPQQVAKFTALGYGRTSGIEHDDATDLVGAGRLRTTDLMTSDFKATNAAFNVDQGSGHGVCFGDSGGPALWTGTDGRTVLLGVASGVYDKPHVDDNRRGFDSCTQKSMYMNVWKFADWIRSAGKQLKQTKKPNLSFHETAKKKSLGRMSLVP